MNIQLRWSGIGRRLIGNGSHIILCDPSRRVDLDLMTTIRKTGIGNSSIDQFTSLYGSWVCPSLEEPFRDLSAALSSATLSSATAPQETMVSHRWTNQ